ncbi:MAG: lysophospholipid acyltransferase family protein, partial [Candidatus Krumholzibacteriota bacterium]
GFAVSLFMSQLPRNRFLAAWGRAIIAWLRITCGLTHEVVGRENIPDKNGIILCKHQSTWETFTLQLIFPPQTWVLKRILMWIPIFGWGLALAGSIAIDRKGGTKALKQVIEKGEDRLAKGLWVVIFPEGTRTVPGQSGKYNPGGAMLAARSGYPVVPVAHNAGVFWPKSGWPIRPGVITMAIGPVIDPEGKKAGEINQQASEWIETRMAEMPT